MKTTKAIRQRKMENRGILRWKMEKKTRQVIV